MIDEVLTALNRDHGDPVAIDTETTGLRIEQGDQLRGVAIAVDAKTWYLPVSHPDSANLPDHLVKRVVWEVRQHDTVVMWNSSFDRTVLWHAFGIEFRDDQIYDGMLGDFAINETASHRLKDVGARIFGIDARKEKEELDALKRGRRVGDVYAEYRHRELSETGADRLPKGRGPELLELARAEAAASKKDWDTFTADDIHDYACQDARLTLDLYWWQQRWFEDHPEYKPALPRLHGTTAVAYRMRQRGLLVDVDGLQRQLDEALERIEELASLWPGVNLKSPKQVQAMVYDVWGLPCSKRTDAGNRSTDKEALMALSYDERVRSLLEFRKLAKRVDALYVPMLNRTSNTGRVHASFNAYRARTGRWSCSGPNIQQVEKERVGELFTDPPGRALWSCDLPQAELRIAAALSGETRWLEAFDAGRDVYAETAEPLEVSRKVGKVLTLQLMYGAGAPSVSRTLTLATGEEWTKAKVRPLIREYWKVVPQVRAFMDHVAGMWERTGRLQILPWEGRFRHRLNMKTGFPEGSHKAGNSVIQGSVAEVVNDWAILIEERLRGTDAFLVCQIHDSLGIEAPDDWTEATVEELFVGAWLEVCPFDNVPWPLAVSRGL